MLNKRNTTEHKWSFYRAGGFDQVKLETADDFVHIDALDQKLWVALGCPLKGLVFDEHTLTLLDIDHDGRIRAPELISAVKWTCSMLKNPALLASKPISLSLTEINDSSPSGKQLLSSARQILKNLGKSGSEQISTDDTINTVSIFAKTQFNGDGIITAQSSDNPDVVQTMLDIMKALGMVPDRCGSDGIDQTRIDRFYSEIEEFLAWNAQAETGLGPSDLGVDSLSAAEAFRGIQVKIDDYFTRIQLAAYDEKAGELLNSADQDYLDLARHNLSTAHEKIATLPLVKIVNQKTLPLKTGINPGWVSSMERFRRLVIVPMLGDIPELTFPAWESLKAKFTSYLEWIAQKPVTAVESLGNERMSDILHKTPKAMLDALVAEDLSVAAEANAIDAVDRLVHFVRYLDTLINNFVSFRDFYDPSTRAIFQVGTLYLDGRSCDLCVQVDDAGKHAELATLSRTFLVYCQCTRRGTGETMTIAAAFTDGDADQLRSGRNGVFYDRRGNDWDATIIKIVEHPISLRQAFWAPYKQIGRMISDQIQKIATARSKAVEEKAALTIADTSKAVADDLKAPAPQAFDVGKFAGIFAAIGLAIGAIGTAIASVVTGFMGLHWWQMPLAIFGIILLVSGPSTIIAYFKLRARNLGPILDGNGWAVNSRVAINIPFGRSLTHIAAIPSNASRSYIDPFGEKKRHWGLYFTLIIILSGLIVTFWKYEPARQLLRSFLS